MLGPASRTYFEHYFSRLKEYYDVETEKVVKRLILEVARKEPVAKEELYKLFLTESKGDKGDMPGSKFSHIMGDIENDFYVTYDFDRKSYSFFTKILKDWWLRLRPGGDVDMELYEYNPALLAPQVLKEILTGRDSELQDIESALENASKGGSFAHTLFIGPRGIGKTHILQIVNLAIKGEIDVKGISEFKDYYIPVIFAEEEYASDITQFTKLILRYLPEQYRFGILDKIASVRIITDKEKEIAVAFLETFKKKTSKILLLLIDNLNDILESFTDEDKSILRNILMTSNSVLLIGAAPSFFDSIINHEEPLYNFFMARKISDLDFGDTKALLNKCAHLSDTDRNNLTEAITRSEAKLKAIFMLAGGNPRLVMSLYHIIADGDVASVELMFLKILNQLTPYFRERMKDLSEQQRKIVDVMTRESTLLTPTEMAHICQLPVNTVNTQIKRLEEIGFVRKASKIKGGKVLYDINERLFSLWRQMRIEAGRTRLEFIIRFLEIWYSPEELMDRLDKTLDDIVEAIRCKDNELASKIDTLWYFKKASSYKVANPKDVDIELLDKIISKCKTKGETPDNLLQAIDEITNHIPDKYYASMIKGYSLRKNGYYDLAVIAFEKATEINHDNYEAWLFLANSYRHLNKSNSALEALKKADTLNPSDYNVLLQLGKAYFGLNEYDKALESFNNVLILAPNNSGAWYACAFIYIIREQNKKAMEVLRNMSQLSSFNESLLLLIRALVRRHNLSRIS
ncbi:MAG: tetratricopeptide repeat protein [Nitrospirae bacterium]|nr:tetratricopeptide repeat protein [Nitrospirota bacterium]